MNYINPGANKYRAFFKRQMGGYAFQTTQQNLPYTSQQSNGGSNLKLF